MIEKYFITHSQSNIAIACKFDLYKNTAIVGGNNIMIREIFFVVENYFGKLEDDGELRQTQKNKVRFVFNCGGHTFQEGLKLLSENGYSLERVKTLGRIMC